MPRKEEWLTSKQAAEILTASSGHTVLPDYVRVLGNSGKLTTWRVDDRTKLYLKSDVEKYIVGKRGTGEVRREARKPKGEKAIA